MRVAFENCNEANPDEMEDDSDNDNEMITAETLRALEVRQESEEVKDFPKNKGSKRAKFD